MLPAQLWVLVPGLLALRVARAQRDPLVCTNTAQTGIEFNSGALNPCQQYLALRQHCEPEYTVPLMNRTTTTTRSPDLCASNSACCCNTVAFNLAMACLSCQQGEDISAPKGAYQAFLNGCPAPRGKGLDLAIQTRVCEDGPVLKQWAYDVSFKQGSWSAAAAKKAAAKSEAGASPCVADTTQNNQPSPSPSSASEPPPSSGGQRAEANAAVNPQTLASNEQPNKDNSGVTVAAAVGAVLGTVALCAIGFALLWWFYLRGPRNVRKRDPQGGREAGEFDLLPSERGSRTNSMQSRERVFPNNPYITSAAQRPRPETQTFSELTLPVPLAVPSDFQQSSYSGTPFSPSFPNAPGGWRNGTSATAPSVHRSVTSSRAPASIAISVPQLSVPQPLVVANKSSTRDQPMSP